MWSEEQFIALEEEEKAITDETILLMLFVMSGIRDNLEKELRDFYSKYGTDGVVTYSEARKWISENNRKRRLTGLSMVVGASFAAALVDIEKHFRRFLIEIVDKESKFFGIPIDVDKLLSKRWGPDDLYWLQRLESDVELWRAYINTDIKRAILQKQSIDVVIERLNKRFKNIESVIERLGLSESTAMGSMSRQTIFKELGVGSYKIHTEVDDLRCEVCESLHGAVFPMTAFEVGITASPFHPRCRCWEEPVLE